MTLPIRATSETNAVSPAANRLDLLVVGGGLAGLLIGLRVLATQPELELVVLERSSDAGPSRTWCFHETDLEGAPWLRPFIDHSWPGHEVRFPGLARRLASPYHAIRLEAFVKRAQTLLGPRLRLQTEVAVVGEREVMLASGHRLHAEVVIDARGLEPSVRATGSGFQKFIGWDVELEEPHGLREPLLMDATVEQLEGFRFIYLLPWDERRLLIEDTRYSDSPELKAEHFAREIEAYASRRGWRIKAVERVEKGVLPIPFSQAAEGAMSPFAVGYRGGFFHPVTGYSAPEAIRLAECLGELKPFTGPSVARAISDLRAERERHQAFFTLLNRMLFLAARPERRYLVLERFYGLTPELIARFYSGRPLLRDKLRILAGRPPVPLLKALRVLRERGPAC